MKTIIILIMMSSLATASDLIYKHGFEAPVSVAGSVSGLSSSGLSIQLNSGSITEIIAINTNTTFVFAADLQVGASWSVIILSQPTPPQSCQISNASGIIPPGGVNNILISCMLIWSSNNWDEGSWN